MADFLVIDVGGANLAVEIDTEGASMQFDRSGVIVEDADDGSKLVTQLHAIRRNAPMKSKWLTTEEFEALKAAAKNGLVPVVVGAHFLRTTTPNTVPQTMTALVIIGQAEYFAQDDDFLHIASISIEESL